MIILTGNYSEKWNELFGKNWGKISEICPEIGGFIIDHKNRKVIMDHNSLRLAETDKAPDYDEMIDLLNILESDSTTFSRLAPQIFCDDGNFTAGILRWHYAFLGAHAKSVVPICERRDIISKLRNCRPNSMLALVEFSMSDGSALEEYHVFGAMTAFISVFPKGTVLCANYKNCFWVFCPEYDGDSNDLLAAAQQAVKESGQGARLGEHEASRYICFTAGLGDGSPIPLQRMATAEFALYQANAAGPETILRYSSEQYEINKIEYEQMSKFLRLVTENLFIYYFQPIVSAKDGEVVAYEMLMRTDKAIGMNPLEILGCADKAKRLYDIEKATMFNALSIIEKNQDAFKKRKLFVNSITAHMLTDDDWNELTARYGELMEKMVVEFTEQSELSDKAVEGMRARFARANIKTAIDDFGTGYSNTFNLLRYGPDYVKIDRSLISGIEKKPSVRKLVSGFIEFIHENGYQALAEGVETYEELRTMIHLGSDLIQGYYVSKPKPIMLYEVADNVCRDITTINLISSGAIYRPYVPADGEVVDMYMVKSDGYNAIHVENPTVTLRGRKDLAFDMPISVQNGVNCEINLENLHIKTEKTPPVVDIGNDCEVSLQVIGNCELDGRGIHVPHSSSLKLWGAGNLNLISYNEDCFAIGTGSHDAHGNITIAMRGNISILANGDTVVGIGGGRNDYQKAVRIIDGHIHITLNGGSCLAIGSYEGSAIVDMENCELSITVSSPDIVGVGGFHGNVDIEAKNITLTENLSGINIAGIGTVEAGTGRIALASVIMHGTMKGRIVNCVGGRGGNISIRTRNSFITLYSESGSVSGIGDKFGSGEVILDRSHLDFEFRTGDGFAYGSRDSEAKLIDTKENIRINA